MMANTEVDERASKRRRRRQRNAQPAEVPASSPKSESNQQDDDEMEALKCAICFDLPSPSDPRIFQCSNGHMYCAECLDKLFEVSNAEANSEGNGEAKCPVCKSKLIHSAMIRNRFAETVLSKMMVPCPQCDKGCTVQVCFANVIEHAKSECDFRPVPCRFAVLGCDWQGEHRHAIAHNSECKIPSTKLKTLKRMVEEKFEAEAQRYSELRTEMERLKVVYRAIEQPCRSAIIKDIVIEFDQMFGVHSSATFKVNETAFHVCLEDVGEENGLNAEIEIGMRVILIDPARENLKYKVIVARGPQLRMVEMLPRVFNMEINRGSTRSELFPLPLTARQSIEQASTNLRLTFVELNGGLMRNTFTAQIIRRQLPEDSTENDSSSEDEQPRRS